MGRDNNSLDEIELDEKNNWVRDRKIHPELIKKGCSRIQEKFTGRRSGIGNAVLGFYDDMVKLWVGPSATESLTCGISPEDINLSSCSSTGTSSSFNNDTNESDEDNNVKNIELTN